MSFNTIIVGLLVSLGILETIGLYPGGIIVPAYLVLYVADEPLRLVSTVVIAVCTVGLFRLVSRYALLFGRRRFVFMIVSAAFLTAALNYVVPDLSISQMDMRVIGLLIPGLIANNAEKQGVGKTICAMTIAVVLTFLILQLTQLFVQGV